MGSEAPGSPRVWQAIVTRVAGLAVVVVVAAVAFRAATRARDASPGPSSSGAAALDASVVPLADLEIAGCAAVTLDGVCTIREGATLRAWLASSASRVTFELDGAALAPMRATVIQDGTRFELRVPIGAHFLRVAIDGAPVASRVLGTAPALPEVVVQARALRAKGELEAADAVLTRERARQGNAVDPMVTGTLARVALARGDVARVDSLFAESIDANERAGIASGAVEDSAALIYSWFERARFADAHALLARARALARRYPEGTARLALYDARLASSTGDRRRALFGFRATADHEERLGLDRDRRMALQDAAMELDAIGRVADAIDDLVALYTTDAGGMDPCDRADLETNVGWIALHLRGPERVDTRMWLRRAIASQKGECPASYDPSRLASLFGYLARAELDRGALDQAAARLGEAAATMLHPPPRIDIEWRATRADLALARGDVAATLVELDGLRAAAEALGDRESLRAALEGRAAALARRGDRVGALDALARAAAIVDATIVAVPLGEGRDAFVRARETNDARRVDLLLALDRPEDALRELRRARSRLVDALAGADRIASLDATARARWEDAVGAYRRDREALDADLADDWRYSAQTLADRRARRAIRVASVQATFDTALAEVVHGRSELPSLDTPGEITLAYFAGTRGWYVFVVEDGHVRAKAIGDVDTKATRDALAAKLLAPFDAELGRARRVAVLAYGAARAVDFHALPWRGPPLGATLPVVYPLDRSARSGSIGAIASPRVLVVGDPTSDLKGARAELDAVAAGLTASGGWAVTVLRDKRASGDAVRSGLATADLFHYAGHGRFAGRDGWASALRLAQHGELSVADILALPRAPRAVFLLGCDTARDSGEADGQGLGLAQAFLVVGARAVVAASRPVDDAATAAIATEIYARLTTEVDVAETMRAVVAAATARGLTEWDAFRVLAP